MVSAAPEEPQRISKVLARAGVASRRDIERMITEGRITLNGKLLDTPVVNITAADEVLVDGEPVRGPERTRLWLYHKPAGLVTTNSDPEGRPTVFDNLPEELPRVLSIGRLDINTEGLLLLTNDGGLARVLELPTTGWLRRYRVRAHGEIDQAELDKLKGGIAVDGVLYGAIDATLDRTQGANVWLTMGLREGKNREIKNVLGALGLDVNRLIRISYGPFQLGDLPEGGVQEVRGRMLRDQLGPRLIDEAKANFDAPIYNDGTDSFDGRTVRDEDDDRAEGRGDWKKGEKGERPPRKTEFKGDKGDRREEGRARLDTRRPSPAVAARILARAAMTVVTIVRPACRPSVPAPPMSGWRPAPVPSPKRSRRTARKSRSSAARTIVRVASATARPPMARPTAPAPSSIPTARPSVRPAPMPPVRSFTATRMTATGSAAPIVRSAVTNVMASVAATARAARAAISAAAVAIAMPAVRAAAKAVTIVPPVAMASVGPSARGRAASAIATASPALAAATASPLSVAVMASRPSARAPQRAAASAPLPMARAVHAAAPASPSASPASARARVLAAIAPPVIVPRAVVPVAARVALAARAPVARVPAAVVRAAIAPAAMARAAAGAPDARRRRGVSRPGACRAEVGCHSPDHGPHARKPLQHSPACP